MRIPVYTLDLVRRYWAPLLCVYTAGTFLHGMLLRGMVWISDINAVVGLLGLGLATLVTLATTILMFHMLRPGLPVVDTELVGARPVKSRGERVVVDAVAMAILPFLVFYSAWGMYAEEFRTYSQNLVNERGITGYVETAELSAFGLPLAFALACWCLRLVVERYYNSTGNTVLGLLTAVFEANWMFLMVFSVAQLIDRGQAWLADRVVWEGMQHGLQDFLRWVNDAFPLPFEVSYPAALAVAAAVWSDLKEGLLGPLLWLTIAAVVFGAELDKHESLFRKGSRGERLEKAVGRTPGMVRGIGKFAGRDLHDKYTPFLNSFRLILRVSPVFYLAFCLYYTLMELGAGWLERGIYVLVGPADFLGWWWQWLEPVTIGVDALHELLRVCLLAATFELILRRISASSTGRRARRPVRAE
ncbi:hypothetical protein [Haloactinospora alba]|uniref:hypothetical protein n=1 Tax=Haloactinospora alba TaxID=405555 RepID=UPI001FEB0F67|nr:hypothetical protein [Haloactinospora alba]